MDLGWWLKSGGRGPECGLSHQMLLFSGLSVTRGQHCNIATQEMVLWWHKKSNFKAATAVIHSVTYLHDFLPISAIFGKKRSLLFLLLSKNTFDPNRMCFAKPEVA